MGKIGNLKERRMNPDKVTLIVKEIIAITEKHQTTERYSEFKNPPPSKIL